MVSGMAFRWFLPLPVMALALAALLLLPHGVRAAGAHRPVVVELYTSQGCNSCPPADALIGQLAQRKDVIALSLPINYWDMLGWKDTLASDADTKRQKAYAQVMGRGGVYTPQMIVDGVSDVVGSREAQVTAAIAQRQSDAQNVPVTVTADKTVVHVAVGPDEHADNNATIWLFRIQPQATVTITSGENSGHTYTYRNVVRDVRALGMWKGQPVTLDLPRQELMGTSHDSIAVIVQQGGYGRVVGAAMLDRPDFK